MTHTSTRSLAIAALLAVLVALAMTSPASARTREFWIQAQPTTWNVVPNGRDALTGETFSLERTMGPAVTYRRYTRGWRRPLTGERIPGPLLRARVGDRLLVHFRNADPVAPHSMHFHGVDYRVSSDGAWLPGFSGPGADVRPGESFTYELRAGPHSAGFWPYHDHSPAMHESIPTLFGGLSILGRHERAPDREFTVVFSPLRGFQAINGRAFVGNTPVRKARVGDLVQWNVMALGSEFHTFHVHGHHWVEHGIGRDTRTVGPAESFRVRWRERAPGTWFYHCHVEDHMGRGMVGTYRVAR